MGGFEGGRSPEHGDEGRETYAQTLRAPAGEDDPADAGDDEDDEEREEDGSGGIHGRGALGGPSR